MVLFHDIPDKGLATVPLDILTVGAVSALEIGDNYYGPKVPDIGFIIVNVTNLKPVNLVPELRLREGDSVAISGFPLGTGALRAPGWLHQLSPTLQKGIISAILPFPCGTPHGILLDLMVQGGSSGSPVLDCESGEIIGMVYAGIDQTTITLALPSHFLDHILSKISEDPEILTCESKQVDFNELVADESRWIIAKPKKPRLEPCEVEE